ncbi:hypothetical protein C8R48DRAFT_768962 [Suillus tomentosus]|nr:hypothetical protein C8R48DRAFT_768962 [Suillus tomentosus]
MLSSPASADVSPKLNSNPNHCKSTQKDVRIEQPRDDHSRKMTLIDSNQQPLPDKLSRSSVSQSKLPPVTSHMSCYAKRAVSRFKPYQLGGHAPTALEHRFTMRNISKGNEVDLSEIDIQKGKEIFKRGIKHMTDATVRSAVVAKRADAECKRLRALTTAWELESTEKHAVFLQTLLKDNAEQYAASLVEASFFERLLTKRSMQQLEDDADFNIAAYTYDFSAHRIANTQLDYLEEAGAERSLSIPEDDSDSEDAEDRLTQCVNSIFMESQNFMFTVA